ncbi:MAG: hypothetical protein PHU23_15685, partial [Dehalococcoidales bacterium]|nr:hypothetical protein [Dehalococcoidales bacterium]
QDYLASKLAATIAIVAANLLLAACRASEDYLYCGILSKARIAYMTIGVINVFSPGIFSSGQYLHVLLSSLLTDVYPKLICHPLK